MPPISDFVLPLTPHQFVWLVPLRLSMLISGVINGDCGKALQKYYKSIASIARVLHDVDCDQH